MNPLLVTSAVSAASDIIHSFAERASRSTPKAGPQAVAPASFASLLEKAGLDHTNRAERVQSLSSRLLRSAEVAGALNQTGAPANSGIQISPNGDATLHLLDGSLKPIQLSEELRAVARELCQLRQPVSPSATSDAAAKSVIISA